MSHQNRKRSKQQQPDQREQGGTDYPVVFPRHLWLGLSKTAKAHVRSANAGYNANDVELTGQGRTHRMQSRMSMPVLAKMAMAVPGSNTDGSCPVLLRDLADGTKALAAYVHAIRVFAHAHAVQLAAVIHTQPAQPTPAESASESPMPNSEEENLTVVQHLLRLVADFPSTLIYEGDTSSFNIAEDAQMAEEA